MTSVPVSDFKGSRWRETVKVSVCRTHSTKLFILSIHGLFSAQYEPGVIQVEWLVALLQVQRVNIRVQVI